MPAFKPETTEIKEKPGKSLNFPTTYRIVPPEEAPQIGNSSVYKRNIINSFLFTLRTHEWSW